MWASFVAIFHKEFLHLRRDKSTLAIALMIPLFQLVLFGFLDQTVHDLPTVVVDQSRSQASREFMDQLRATNTFDIEHVTGDPDAARADIRAGRARVGVLIPPDFHDKLTRQETAQVLVLIDGSDSTASSGALAAVNGLAAARNIAVVSERAAALGASAAMPLEARPIILFNPAGRTANYIIPGLVAIMLQIVAMALAAVALVRERERGTLEQLLVTPIDPLGLMLGKLGPYLVVGLVEMALVLSAMRFGFAVPIRGSVLFLFAMALVYLLALLSMGLFLSTRAQNQAQAFQMAQMFLLPSIFLSGYIFPSSGLPAPLYWLGQLLPATHMIVIMRGVVLRDAGFLDLLPNVLAMAAMTVVLVGLSVRNFKKISV
jgi:ABC-2 type transport system permease protein